MANINIVISTHQGKLYDEVCDYVVISSNTGQYQVLKDHLPVCSTISEGYVKLVTGTTEYYVVIINGLFEFHENKATLIAQEAHIGNDYETAKSHLDSVTKARLERNRARAADYTKSEKDIRDNLKKTGAGKL